VLALTAIAHAHLATRTPHLALTVLMDTISQLMMNKLANNYQLVALKSAAEDALTAVMTVLATLAPITTTDTRTVLMQLFASEIAPLVTPLLIAQTNALLAKSTTVVLAPPTDSAQLASRTSSLPPTVSALLNAPLDSTDLHQTTLKPLPASLAQANALPAMALTLAHLV
jgi:hypothetical protein